MRNNGVGEEAGQELAVEQSLEFVHDPSRWQRMREGFKGSAWRYIATVGMAGGLLTGAYFISQADAQDYKGFDITTVGQDIDLNVTTLGNTLIDYGIEVGGSVVLAAGIADAANTARKNRKNFQLAWEGLDATHNPEIKHPNKDEGPITNVVRVAANKLSGSEENQRFFSKLRRHLMLPLVGITALSTAVLIDKGISEGGTRSLKSMISGIEASDNGLSEKNIDWLFQPGTYHFMDNSVITPETVQSIQDRVHSGQAEGVHEVLPFQATLTAVPTSHNETQAGLLVKSEAGAGRPSLLTPEVQEGANCEIVEDRCVLGPDQLVADKNEGFSIGDTIEIQGRDYHVVGFSKEAQSLLNRMVVYTGLSEADKNSNYFGLVTVADSQEDVKKMLEELGVSDQVSAESTHELLDQTEKFWEQNGTPLVTLLVLNIAALGTVSFFVTRRFEQERNKSLIATLRATGMSEEQIKQQMRAGATLDTVRGAFPATIATAALGFAINSGLPGFHAELTPEMLTGAAGTILAAQIVAGKWSMRLFNRQTLAEQMKQE